MVPAMATTLDWYGCATFRLRTGGLTIFLDAYIDRAANAAGPGLVADDVTEADWILVGHSHFDHLYGAERIVAQHGRHDGGQLRVGAGDGAGGRSSRPDDLRRRWRKRLTSGLA